MGGRRATAHQCSCLEGVVREGGINPESSAGTFDFGALEHPPPLCCARAWEQQGPMSTPMAMHPHSHIVPPQVCQDADSCPRDLPQTGIHFCTSTSLLLRA